MYTNVIDTALWNCYLWRCGMLLLGTVSALQFPIHGSSKESRRFGGHRKVSLSPQRYQKNYSPVILGL